MAAACTPGPNRSQPIGEAFAGPATLNLRREIAVDSPVVATVKHGDRLEILQHRRIFFRVRARKGAEGWVDERQLLAASDMQNLKRLAQAADKLPSQGAASPRFGDMRIYTLPSRESPSFITIKEKEKVDVLAHATIPRVRLTRTPILPPAPKKAPLPKRVRQGSIPPVPPPKPPPVPDNWQDLSKTDTGEPPDEPANAPPPQTDDWSLVRTADGQAGWTLTRRLDMAIPDDVAQYAEGRRIVSYFPLGSAQDGDQKKNTWLWTTIGEGSHPYDFDNFRVFIWSPRRHRYETAYIERKVAGFEPVTLEMVTYSGSQYPGFSICLEKKDGAKSRREYALLANIVRLAGERPCETQTPAQLLAPFSAPPEANAGAPTPARGGKPSFVELVKRKVHAFFRK